MHQGRGLIAADAGLEHALDPPLIGQLLAVAIHADRQPGQIGGAERGSLGDLRSDHRDAEQVGLKLQQQIIGRSAAIDAQLGDRRHPIYSGVSCHRQQQCAALERDRFQCRARDMRDRAAARQADDRALRRRLPIRRAETGERRHEYHAAGVWHRCRQRFDVG